MNELIETKNIESIIYEIRGKQVIFDTDLAKIYKTETKRINEAVRNNPIKFPERYAFRISEAEYSNLKSKFSSSSQINNHGGSRKGHIAFTEHGVYMLATVLKSKIAAEITLTIMDTFVAMKHNMKYNNGILINHENRILKLENIFNKFEERKNETFLTGQTYDAYSKIIDIFKEAKKELVIIDRYSDKTILDMIRKLKCKVILITSDNLNNLDIKKYNSEYDNLTVIRNDTYHDRYFIIDRKKVYHSGTSINYAGSRTFSINILEDSNAKSLIINDIKNLESVL